MSDSISSIEGGAAAAKAVQPTSADPTTAGQVAQANASKKEFSTDTIIKNVADLKEQAPEVYQKMMEGIAMTIVREMKEHEERLKKMQREGRER